MKFVEKCVIEVQVPFNLNSCNYKEIDALFDYVWSGSEFCHNSHVTYAIRFDNNSYTRKDVVRIEFFKENYDEYMIYIKKIYERFIAVQGMYVRNKAFDVIKKNSVNRC